LELVNAANARLAQNDATGPSGINRLGSGSDMTGFAIANALDGVGAPAKTENTANVPALIDVTDGAAPDGA